MEVTIKELEVMKLNLSPSDTLVVKLKGERMSEEDSNNLAAALRRRFPNNKVIVFTLPEEHDIIFEVVNESEPKQTETT